MPNLLVTIPFSHFCEKARWSLDRCGVPYHEDAHAPIFHFLAARRAGGKRTVPVLRASDGRVIADSTEIAAWADSHKPGELLPDHGAPAALALEDDFDRQLGPAARRWGYCQLLPRPDAMALMRGHIPSWELSTLRVMRPLATVLMRRNMNVTPAGVARSREKIDATFARVGELLADGRRYLCGARFTIADLTFAALAAPVLRPAENTHSFPADLVLSPEATAEIAAWRATPAGQFALRIYSTER